MSLHETTEFSRADSNCGKLQRVVYEALLKHEQAGELPTSRRFIFYELEHQGVVSKEQKLYADGSEYARRADQDFQDAVTHVCNVKNLWPWFVDETRNLFWWSGTSSAKRYCMACLEDEFMLDRWPGVAGPLIITEARTAGGVFIRTVTPKYDVAIASTNGQCHGFLVTRVAQMLRECEHTILYVGDLDVGGDQIERNTRRILEDEVGPLSWQRIAITSYQAQLLKDRGVNPVKKKDWRYSDGHPHEAYELEALGQGPLTRLLTNRLDRLLPVPLKDVLEREAREREDMMRYLKRKRGK